MPRYNITRRNNKVNNSNSSATYRDYYDHRGRKKRTESFTNTYTSVSTSTSSGGLSYSINLGYTAILRYMFVFSLVVVILSLFLKGVFDPKFQELFNTEIYYTSNGYEYPVSYLNYDWQFKINQLSGFKPIIDIELWQSLLNNNIFDGIPILDSFSSIFKYFNVLLIPISILDAIITDFVMVIGFITIW